MAKFAIRWPKQKSMVFIALLGIFNCQVSGTHTSETATFYLVLKALSESLFYYNGVGYSEILKTV